MAKKTVYAKSKYIRMSAQKTRLVVDMIRGENALYSAEMLKFVNKAAALPVRKALESAIANAEFNHDMDKKQLVVVEARVDEAPTFKRGRAVSKGRYHQILKRNCHIIIGVAEGKIKDKEIEKIAAAVEKEEEKQKLEEKKVEEAKKTEKVEEEKSKEKGKVEKIKNVGGEKKNQSGNRMKGLIRRVQSRGN